MQAGGPGEGVVGPGGSVAAFVIAVLVAPESNSQFASAALAVTFATTAAVAIERTIEAMWGFVGQSKQLGGWWPLNAVRAHIVAFETKTNGLVSGPLTDAVSVLETARDALDPTSAQAAIDDFDAVIARVERERLRLEAKIDKAGELAPGSPRFGLIEEAAADGFALVDWVVEQTGTASVQARALAEQAGRYSAKCEQARDIVASFTDNPARKGASLLIGMSLGLLAAGAMGVNLFDAIATGDEVTGRLAGDAGVLITGVVVGLGSSPTHELIKTLERRRKDNGLPTIAGLPGDDGAGGGVVGLMSFPGIAPSSPSGPGSLVLPSSRRRSSVRMTD